jgi:hypothetical protein
MRLFPAEALRAFAVGSAVNDPENEGPARLAAGGS